MNHSLNNAQPFDDSQLLSGKQTELDYMKLMQGPSFSSSFNPANDASTHVNTTVDQIMMPELNGEK